MCRPVELNSQKLKDAFLRKYKKDTKIKLPINEIKKEYFQSYQAHHIIPVEIIEENVDASQYKKYNDEWNCLMIPACDEIIIHCKNHPRYNEFVREFITMLWEVFPDYSFEDIAKGIAEVIREDFNNALTMERLNNRKMSMDTFAEKYLWNVYC